jgi:2-succinyl-5-enolpyruvyl-6-hydroxy-3-cyclohexene-1-carboxylate synthase
MPVRDVETFWPVRSDPPRVLCNRGASGIDGTVSAAFGAAAFGPTVLLVGDVALAHDIGGLLAAPRLQLSLAIVLLNNGGGGIFDFLPVSGAAMALAADPAVRASEKGPDGTDVYTRHVATPTGLDFARAAALYGLGHERPGDVAGFRAALERALAGERCTLIEVAGERVANVGLHRGVWGAVAAALSR